MQLVARLSVFGLILFGTSNSLFSKVVYELTGVGLDGQEKLFKKPWWMTTIMFIGMSFCLPVAYYQEALEAKEKTAAAASLNGDLGEPLLNTSIPTKGSLKETLLLSIPSFFDLIATVLMNIGLLSVTASVYQMMRGAEMLFAALFAVVFLKRHLNHFHFLGILCCVIGIGAVGMSSILSGEGSSTHPVSTEEMLMGMGLIVASQAVQAAQLTFEDFFMADLNMAPLKIVGFEGVFGVAFMAVLLPLAYYLPGPEGIGFHEDTLDTLHMIASSKGLRIILSIQLCAALAYNMCGMFVTGHLGAVFRTVLETMRTLFVWLLGLLLFYTPLGMGRLGESWTVWSYLQAAGFVVLVIGTLVYGRGDEQSSKEELVAAVGEALAADSIDAARAPSRGDAEGAALLGVGAVPVAVSGGGGSGSAAAPVAIASSLKSTMNLNAGSYTHSFSRSLSRGAAFPLGGGDAL